MAQEQPVQTMLPTIPSKSCLIFGCGNPLFGDDGFGPEVIEYLETHYHLPQQVLCMDAGTSVRDTLFDILLSENKPRHIIIIDAAEQKGKSPGDIFEIDLESMDPRKTSDFSLHQFPTTNMLKELKELTDVDIRVLVVQIAHIPEEINPGLSGPVLAAVPDMCHRLMEIISTSGY